MRGVSGSSPDLSTIFCASNTTTLTPGMSESQALFKWMLLIESFFPESNKVHAIHDVNQSAVGVFHIPACGCRASESIAIS